MNGRLRFGPNVFLRPLGAADAPSLLELRLQDRDFLTDFEPHRQPSYFTRSGQAAEIAADQIDDRAGAGHAFGIFLTKDEQLAGRVRLSNLVRGAWHNATLGYFVGRAYSGRGVATEAVGLVLGFAFEEVRLHRVQAGVMPHNDASRRVLEKNGFRLEGRSKRYLYIGGAWQDHDLYAITEEEWPQ
ncbi:ribosomal protein S5-alanine N-acetyltransferase [soil metagenome]